MPMRAATLDELINNIKFTPRDDKKTPNDSVKLTAETAADGMLTTCFANLWLSPASARLLI